jgi:pimeloyl-ACP methyl ester carboxylesterase
MKTLLLPGLDGTGALFEPFLSKLDRSLGPIVISYPESRATPPDIALPRGEPFAIVAESFSGPIALRIAADRPQGLVGLVLVATFIRSPMPWLPAMLVRPWLLGRLAHSSFLNRRQLLDDAASDELLQLVNRTIARVPPAVLAARVRTILALDAKDALAACRVPILYLQGTRDRIVSESSVNAMRDCRPDLIVERIDAPHLVLQCNPAAASRAIERFLEPRKKIDPSIADC